MTKLLLYFVVIVALGLFIYTAVNGVQDNQQKRMILTDIHKTCLELGYTDYQAVELSVNEFDTWCITPVGGIYHLGIYDIQRIDK